MVNLKFSIVLIGYLKILGHKLLFINDKKVYYFFIEIYKIVPLIKNS